MFGDTGMEKNTDDKEVFAKLETMKLEYAKKKRKLLKIREATKRKAYIKDKLNRVNNQSETPLLKNSDILESSASKDMDSLSTTQLGEDTLLIHCSRHDTTEDSVLSVTSNDNMTCMDQTEREVAQYNGWDSLTAPTNTRMNTRKEDYFVSDLNVNSESKNKCDGEGSHGWSRRSSECARDVNLRAKENVIPMTKSQMAASRLVEKCQSQKSGLYTAKTVAVSPLCYLRVKENLKTRLALLELSDGKNRRFFPQLPKLVIEQNLMLQKSSEFCLPVEDFEDSLTDHRKKLINRQSQSSSECLQGLGSLGDFELRKHDHTAVKPLPHIPALESSTHSPGVFQELIIHGSDPKLDLSTHSPGDSVDSSTNDTTLKPSLPSPNCTVQPPGRLTEVTPEPPLYTLDLTLEPSTPLVTEPYTIMTPQNKQSYDLRRSSFLLDTPDNNLDTFVTSTPMLSERNVPMHCEVSTISDPLSSVQCLMVGKRVYCIASTKRKQDGRSTHYIFLLLEDYTVRLYMMLERSDWTLISTWQTEHWKIDHMIGAFYRDDVITLIAVSLDDFLTLSCDVVTCVTYPIHILDVPSSSSRCTCCTEIGHIISASKDTITKYTYTPNCLITVLSSWKYDLDTVTSICVTPCLPSALIGLTVKSFCVIWNHDVGVLLTVIPLSLPLHSYLGYVTYSDGLLWILSESSTDEEVSIHVTLVNPSNSKFQILAVYTKPSSHLRWQIACLFRGSLLYVDEENKLICYNLITEQSQSFTGVLSVSAETDSVYIAHSNGYLHIYTLDDLVLMNFSKDE